MFINPNKVFGGASNIKTGTNPPFTLEDFYKIYPQFGKDSEGKQVVDEEVIQMYLDFAHASVKQVRWHSSWRIGMSLFIAHFLTLHLQGMADSNSGAAAIIEAGKAKGLDTSMSVDGVSVSTDYSILASSVNGWASWKSTVYGQQLSSIGKLLGKGGMVIP